MRLVRQGMDAQGDLVSAWLSNPDGNGTVRQLSAAGGAITLARSYTPWGELLEQHGGGDPSASSGPALTWGYFGGLLDAATGLLYVGRRKILQSLVLLCS